MRERTAVKVQYLHEHTRKKTKNERTTWRHLLEISWIFSLITDRLWWHPLLSQGRKFELYSCDFFFFFHLNSSVSWNCAGFESPSRLLQKRYNVVERPVPAPPSGQISLQHKARKHFFLIMCNLFEWKTKQNMSLYSICDKLSSESLSKSWKIINKKNQHKYK